VGVPERTCIGCRRRRPSDELIRLKVSTGRLALGAGGQAGRSAYLCPEPACLDKALSRRAAARAFRRPVEVDERLRREFTQACEARRAVR